MIGKIVGATLGRKAANAIGTKVGGPMGAAIGYGLASRRLRGAALGGLAVMGGMALYRRLRSGTQSAQEPFMANAQNNGMTATEIPETNEDPMPAYAPR